MKTLRDIKYVAVNKSRTLILYSSENENGFSTVNLKKIKGRNNVLFITEVNNIDGLGFYSINEFYLLRNSNLELYNLSGKISNVVEINVKEILYNVIKINGKIIIITNSVKNRSLLFYEYNNNHKKLIFTYNYSEKMEYNKIPKHIVKIVAHFNLTSSYYPDELLDSYKGSYILAKKMSGNKILYIIEKDNIYMKLNCGRFFVHNAFYLSRTKLLLHISNYNTRPSLILYDLRSDPNQINQFLQSTDLSIDVAHLHLDEHNLPVIKFSSATSNSRNVVIMLHGGPYYHFDLSYDYLTEQLLKKNFTLYKLNPVGSTGYTEEYRHNIKKKAGILDLKQVVAFIEELNNQKKDNKIYILGNSYGGYLCCLLAFVEEILIHKIICTGPFTDIRYQMLFSNSQALMDELFDKKNLKKVNPLDIALMKPLRHSLTILHGKVDKNCPYKQVLNFKDITKHNSEKSLKVKILDDYGHYPLNKREEKTISKLIIKELN